MLKRIGLFLTVTVLATALSGCIFPPWGGPGGGHGGGGGGGHGHHFDR
ncbi:MAG: hypothetical protein ACRC0C_07585 [Gibbsiella quercinecans]|nr:hypothetical protein [Gibbsiella quercinecans]